MNRQERIKKGKFLSLILRHKPEIVNMKPDEGGWFKVNELLKNLDWSRKELDEIVASNNKNRYGYNSDSTHIRAHQGHSIKIDLGYEPVKPPEFLYQGTVEKFITDIKETGLDKMKRHDVHLTEDIETAKDVGRRRGKPLILKIRSGDMYRNGFIFNVTPNNVWLTKKVPVEYITFPD